MSSLSEETGALKPPCCPPDIFNLTLGLCSPLLICQTRSNIPPLCHSCTGIAPEATSGGRNFGEKSRDHDTSVIPLAANMTLSPRRGRGRNHNLKDLHQRPFWLSDSTLLKSCVNKPKLVLLLRPQKSCEKYAKNSQANITECLLEEHQ